MKIITVTALFVAVAYAEPPVPSHSYLPPSTRSQGGYPKGPAGFAGGSVGGGPQVVAARNLGGNGYSPHGSAGNNFARNSPHGQSQFGRGAQGYDHNASPFGRNGLDDANPEPANYNFGYMVNDYHEGTDFGHHEERQDERAAGEYHVVLPDGRKQTVSYEADERGFKPQISYQDSEADGFGRSGYDSNANNVRSNGGSNHDNGFGNLGRSNHGNGRGGY